MNIRPAHSGDARAIAELLCNIDDHPHWKARGADDIEQTARASLEWHHPERLVFVAELEGRIVGYAAVYWLRYLFHQREDYVRELFVRSDASGQDVGSALLEAIRAEAKALGCRRLTLVNLKDNESYRRGFYTNRGWQETNTVRFVYDLKEQS